MLIRRCLPLGAILLAGCVKQDTEILSRVGRKLGDKIQASTSDLRDKLPFKIVSAEPPAPVQNPQPTLTDQIRQRLTLDKALAAIAFDVQVSGAQVELKGTVEKEDQKRRAIDLVESTQGVDKVVDSIQIRGE